ncbi:MULTISPECIES: hypothetical protein [Clostridium]|jgi:hypothetical protein|uniref:Uncharacterized protein n=1 Tax=Candidatus Clostridium helianthi TaxID=3381660 RepID=A0ABW8S729_9CLOT|nr:hypothetical protein CBE01nite_32490 [Clostridium beijerinckii]
MDLKLDLDKKDLISLVKGTDPNLNVMEHPKISCCGNYRVQNSRWDWNQHVFEKYTDEEIYEIYKICKNSWGE